MSLYAEYIKELSGKHIIESEKGFCSYSITEDKCYLEEIYVRPEFRGQNISNKMCNEIINIAKELGCKKFFGTVIPSANNSTISLKMLISNGFKLENSFNNLIVFVKDLE